MRTLLSLAVLLPLLAHAQANTDAGWQACTAIGNAADRLACYDRWAESQRAPAPAAAPAPEAQPTETTPATLWRALGLPTLHMTAEHGCRDPGRSEMSRFWELEPGASCGTFGLRGYRPITMSVVAADTVNRQPTSGNPMNNAETAVDYRTTEARLQLSVRTKVAQGLLVRDQPDKLDSLWFAYTQQSYWQLFSPGLSRPFRSTDHEPEVVYVFPVQSAAPGRWRLRYGGLGLVHQSNGQSLPLSRSWNRAYLMAGAEYGPWQLHGRVWGRIAEGGTDDNPHISDWVGRAELRAAWLPSRKHTFVVTARHSLRSEGRGSLRLEWYRSLWDDGRGLPNGLQLHTQLFTGYGDSLLDYNRKRTVFTLGLSLVEW